MRMMDIKYLKGAEILFKRNPHLVGSQVNAIFDKIEQKDDGSFVVIGDHPQFWAVNIEEGRKPVWSSPKKPYCKVGQTPENDNCVNWNGDSELGISFFKPGPNKHAGWVTEIYWDSKMKEFEKRPNALWWAAGFILLIALLKKSNN